MTVKLPPPPPWMTDLPTLASHSQPSLAACLWDAGSPIFSLDVRKLRILALRRRCWICGYPLSVPGWVVVTETDVTDRHFADLHTQGSGPLHASCALYACAACPYLRYRKSRRRVTGRSQRGTLSISGFRRYAVIFPPNPDVFMTFGHYDVGETVQPTSQAHVADLLGQAVNADDAMRFTTSPRLYWTDAPEDLRSLNDQWSEAWKTLQSWARTSTATVDDRTYRGHVLGQGVTSIT